MMRNKFRRPLGWLSVFCLLASAPVAAPAGEPFRTDGGDEKLPWFQLVPGEFPPQGSAHYFSGELIQADHLEREFILRVDRTDKQNRSHFDLPVAAGMLPYGSISYHGAPAALRDLPIGTHLHGWFYLKDPDDESPPIEGWHNRRSGEVDFTRCFRLEDDFSHDRRHNRIWRVEKVDLDEGNLTVLAMQSGKPTGELRTYDLFPSTRVYAGSGFGSLDRIETGQEVLFNVTWATLYGPGRITELWLDSDSRKLAAAHQLRKHHVHIRERGLPGWVDDVDNQKRIVTVSLFDNVDPKLFEDIAEGEQAGLAVAEQNLLMYDPVNDRKRGPILSIEKVAPQPGAGGVRVRVQPNLLLEGYRPGRIVRLYPADWPVRALPKEEQLFGR